MTLKKGDMLVIPRGTPHRRSTEGSVTLTLISPMGTASAERGQFLRNRPYRRVGASSREH